MDPPTWRQVEDRVSWQGGSRSSPEDHFDFQSAVFLATSIDFAL